MRISYKKLWLLLLERDISKATLRTDLKLATGTMAKLNKGEEVALSVLMRICQYLRCDIGAGYDNTTIRCCKANLLHLIGSRKEW